MRLRKFAVILSELFCEIKVESECLIQEILFADNLLSFIHSDYGKFGSQNLLIAL